MDKRLLAIVALIFTAALLRLLPHAPNFSPIGAIALFGGAYLTNRFYSFLIPIAAMLISDLFLGFYSGTEMLVTYGAFCVTIMIGNVLRSNKSWIRVGFAALATSIIFFLITNFVFFYPNTMMPLYTRDLAGIMNSYIAGLAFFQNTVISDLFYSTVLFGGFYLLGVNIPSLKSEKIRA
ncbi:MAG: hypothetical protein Q8M15_16545 [Bacteroidota bacterium]|nr:hypothetical protein [Bacteroidota bacterium]